MKLRNIFILALAILTLISCERRRKQDVVILYPNWMEGIAMTHLADVILRDKGYITSLKRIEPGPIYAALSRGDADVYMDAWLPNTHQEYWRRFGHRLDVLGVIFDDGVTGLVVPDYVDINSIEELNNNKDKFGGKIFGIAAGAGIHANTERAITEYGLDFQQISSSETSMLTALRQAESRNEWIIITGWKPHFMWFRHKLKTLEDPKGIYPNDEIRIVSRLGFRDDQPEIADFFKKFVLSNDMLGELINDVESEREPEIGARKFYEKYKSTFNSWLKEKS
ncbi:glycine betaine ABC transporter substrate-binding protein [Massilibacteroides sp.]|uniref:glycine betaine ABC transporter substrate-binding protein n=1 Tax=Massilibacteroides sp. TaxID=2034766 RepID=UPI002618EDEF|nr:glycine betaine ABC transporter substrate-binding protein [Massilibacteroides sp.]MDD4514502.1 glycine betaine ABC transporter substrate-binding protein [Massilibacteroides sp.]